MSGNVFKVGDIVRLKSGGPKMTVYEIADDDEDMIYCRWFVEKKHAAREYGFRSRHSRTR